MFSHFFVPRSSLATMYNWIVSHFNLEQQLKINCHFSGDRLLSSSTSRCCRHFECNQSLFTIGLQLERKLDRNQRAEQNLLVFGRNGRIPGTRNLLLPTKSRTPLWNSKSRLRLHPSKSNAISRSRYMATVCLPQLHVYAYQRGRSLGLRARTFRKSFT